MAYRELFFVLRKKYGLQGWWPVTDAGKTKPVYRERKQLNEKQRLEVCIGAILTQNTSWKNAEKAVEKLNKKQAVDLNKLLELDLAELAKLIRSTGYFNQKALKLKLFAGFLQKNSFKKLETLETFKIRNLLLSVKGIGFETADSVLCYAFNRPVFVVDAYAKRLFSRFYGKQLTDYSFVQQSIHKSFSGAKQEKRIECFKEFHALVVEHCKQKCRKMPLCKNCFLKKKCFFAANQTQEL